MQIQLEGDGERGRLLALRATEPAKRIVARLGIRLRNGRSGLRLMCRCLESAPANGPTIELGRPEPRCLLRHSFARTNGMGPSPAKPRGGRSDWGVARVARIRPWDRRRAPVTFASACSSAWANSPAESIRLRHGRVWAAAHVSVPRIGARQRSHDRRRPTRATVCSTRALKDDLIGPQTVEDGRAVRRHTSRRAPLGLFERNKAGELPKCVCTPAASVTGRPRRAVGR